MDSLLAAEGTGRRKASWRATLNGGAPRLLFLMADDVYFLKHRLGLARSARAAGFEVHVAGPDTGSGRRITEQGFPLWHVRLRKSFNPWHGARAWMDVLRVCRTLRPALLHFVSLRAILWGASAARLASGAPSLNVVTGLGYAFTSGNRWLRWSVERALRFCLGTPQALAVFENSDDLRYFVQRGLVPQGRTAVVPGCGLDTSEYPFLPEPDGVPRVLFASRMLWDKGVAELVQACRILRERGVGHRLALAGAPDRGNPACVPSEVLRGWHAEGLAEWLGQVEDVRTELARSHLVCLPSHREGLPRSLLEAASCGRAIVTTDAPGCREAVIHRVTGLLVPPHSAAALACALQELIENPQLRRAMGQAGRRLVAERFAAPVVERAYLSLYARCLNGQGSGWATPELRTPAGRSGGSRPL